eukprot:6188345-Pleurochrysis_carterae.AAC.2
MVTLEFKNSLANPRSEFRVSWLHWLSIGRRRVFLQRFNQNAQRAARRLTSSLLRSPPSAVMTMPSILHHLQLQYVQYSSAARLAVGHMSNEYNPFTIAGCGVTPLTLTEPTESEAGRAARAATGLHP